MKTITFLAVAALSCATGFSQDVLAPSVTSSSIPQTPVDVTTAVASITVTMHITDAGSGFEFGNLFLYTQAGNFVGSVFFDATQRAPGGSAQDGTYMIPIEVPRYGPPGTWRVDALVEDQAGNRRNLGGPDPNNTPFPDPGLMTFPLINSGQIDSTPPILASPSRSPAAVDVTAGSGTVTFSFGATDATSGLNYGLIYPHDPSGTVHYDLIKYFDQAQRISGTAANGNYQVTFDFPQGSAAGTWTFEIFLQDKVGNNSYGAAGSVAVNSPPPTQFARFLAQAVDAVQLPFATGGAGWVMQDSDSSDGVDSAMSLPVADGHDATFRTNVTGPGVISFKWRVDSEVDSDFLAVSVDGISSGEISGSTGWETKTLPPLGAGNHTVEWTYRKDASGSAGGDRGWVDEVRFEADVDAALPQVQDLRFSSRSLDLTQGMQEVTITVDATDDAKGLSGVRVELFDPSGNGQMSSSITELSETTGSYQFVFQIPSSSPFGLWRAQVTLTEDISGNEVIYGPGGVPFPVKEIENFYAGNPAAADTQDALIRNIEVTPGIIDVTTGAVMATVTLQVTDPLSGVKDGTVSVLNPDKNSSEIFYFNQSARIGGDDFNGIYQVQVMVPQYAVPGTWSVGSRLVDNALNEHEYPYEIAFPTDANETFTVVNTGAVDLTDPVATSISVTPAQINVSAGPATIQVQVSVLDDLSGLKDGYVFFYDPADVYQGSFFSFLDETNRISGNAVSGTYRVTRTLPQGSTIGQWQVRIFLRDRTGRNRFYGAGPGYEPYPLGSGSFTISSGPSTLFAAFVASNLLTGVNALAGADPDNDGRNNAMELMLGTNPTSAASAGAGLTVVSQTATYLNYDFTIKPSLTVTTNGNYLELRDGSGSAPLKVKGETQAGLTGAWTSATPVLLSGSTYRVSLPLSNGATGFLRLVFETQ